jgi:hypothetical protein
MLCGEQLLRHVAPNPGRSVDETGQSVGSPVCLLDAAIRFATSTRNRPGSMAEILSGTPSRVAASMLASVRSASRSCSKPLGRQWMHPRPVQSPHLLGGHRIPGIQAVHAGKAGPTHTPGLSQRSV